MRKLLCVGLLVLLCGAAGAAPKNIIVMIADGWGFEQKAAAEFYDNGGESKFFDWMTPLAMSTYSATGTGYDPALAWSDFAYVKNRPTDSAASATALSTGVRTKNGMIGVDPDGKPLRHIYQAAEDKGKSTGLVTSVLLAHATPAGFSAHDSKRGNYEAISQQMITETPIDVIMGAGHPEYDGSGKKLTPDKTNDKQYQVVGGKTIWDGLKKSSVGADADADGSPDPWALIETRDQFQALGAGDTPKRVLGVAEVDTTLQQERGGDKKAGPFQEPLTETVPTLAEMVRGALNVLDNDPDGLFLMVEGGAVDWAGHDSQSGRNIEEQLAFRDAVAVVKEWVEKNSSWDDTLLVVTADHETGYLTGPANEAEWAPVENKGKGQLPGMKWNSGEHTNSLVPLFVKGADSEAIVAKAVSEDPKRGKYLHSTELSQTLHQLWK
ncbi:MAG: alkaline phosphatase [Candidatus Hydrogenedentes bacterium]|nr:alkaline phosphatase [Candidatus Hydrogenedentota bacterium]